MATSRYSALCEDGPDTSEMVSIQTGARDGEHTKTPAIGPDQDENAKPAGLPDLWSSLLDVCLIIAASLFLVFAMMAIYIKDKSVKDVACKAVEEATKLGPTIYPLLFAALIGRALEHISRYSAERGAQISLLWPLLNSKTTFDAITAQWYLGKLTVPASLLAILWIMSPLGSQASLRLIYPTNLTHTTIQELRYLDDGPVGNIYTNIMLIIGNDGGIPLSIPDTYTAALMQSISTKSGPRDSWGNVKIPRLEHLDLTLVDQDGWANVTNASTVESYTSLFGLPLVGLPESGTVDFPVETAYVLLSCPSIQYRPWVYKGFNVSCLDCVNWQHNDGPENMTRGMAREYAFLGPPFPDLNISQKADPEYTNARLIQFDSSPSIGNSVRATCTVTQCQVEAYIHCTDGECVATKMRQSRTDYRGANFTTFDFWGTFVLDTISLVSQISGAMGAVGSSPSEMFLNDSNLMPVLTGSLYDNMTSELDLTNVNPKLFAERASILLNTAIQTFFAPTGFAGGLPSTNLSLYGPPHIPADGFLGANITINPDSDMNLPPSYMGTYTPFIGASTNATVMQYTEVYKPDYVWVIILSISSFVLLLTGLIGLFLDLHTRAPKIFDPIISLTYDNPYMEIPAHGVPIDAANRAKTLGDIKVRLGDVNDGGAIGKIALGMAKNAKPLVGGRLYK